MPFFSFADGAAMFDSTPIENLFLMEYLPAAPEGYLRVYLYARMLALHPELGSDLAGMASALRMDENAVYEAFAYWERQGLVRRLTDRPPTYELLAVRPDSMALSNPMERDYYENREFNSDLQALFPANKLLHPQEYAMAQDWLDLMHFEPAAVLLAVKGEVKNYKGKNLNPLALFRRLDKRMIKWAERGILSAADLEREIRYDGDVKDTARAVAKRLALRREPTPEELETARRWLADWGFAPNEVLEACEETTKSRSPSFAYLDAILKNRREQGPMWAELSEILKELNPLNALPTPDLLGRYAALREADFEPGMIRLAAVQCHRSNKTRFDEVERMLGKWRNMGLATQADAEAYVQEMERRTEPVRAFLEKCGWNRRPTQDDLERYESWQGVYGAELIDFAAECAKGSRGPVKYADKLLSQWAGEDALTVEAARAAHERGRAAGPAANPALDYAQREYKDEDFGDDLFIDLDKYAEGGGKA